MKKTLLFIILISNYYFANAQSFRMHVDTIKDASFGASTSLELHNFIVNTGTTPATYTWRLATSNTTNFVDWYVGICDNVICYTSGLTNSHTTATVNPGDSTQLKLTLAYGANPTNCVGNFSVIVSQQLSTKEAFYVANKNAGCTTIGITELNSFNSLSVYPLPFQNNFNLKISTQLQKTKSIEIYNLIGTVVFKQDIDATNSEELAISTPNLPKGIYFLSLFDANKRKLVSKRIEKN